MKYGELTLGQMEAIINKLGGMDGAMRLLRGELTVQQSTRAALSITVIYAMSLDDMIAAGRYDWVNDDITAERFPIKRESMKELGVELVHFDCFIRTDEAVEKMDKMGLRQATHEELLAFGAQYPDMQREFPIVALGSSARVRSGDRIMLCLGERDSGRNLGLRWWNDGWGGYCRFLAVYK